MIYIIKTADCDPAFIKIGYSKRDITKRIKTLQTGCPHRLELVLYANGSTRHEKLLHGHLSNYRASGEWFKDSEEVREIIKTVFKKFKGWKPLDPTKIMTERMTDGQKQTNRNFYDKHAFAWLLEEYCSTRKILITELISLPEGKRKYSISRMAWIDASQKYDFLGEEFDGIQLVIHGPINNGEAAKRSLEWLYENNLHASPDVANYKEAINSFKKWQIRHRDFRTVTHPF